MLHLVAVVAVITSYAVQAATTDPVQKVISLLSNLEQQIKRDGEAEQKAHDSYMEWCRTGAKDKEFEITTANNNIEDLSATIKKADSDLATLSSQIEDLGADLASNSGELKAASQIREKEHAEFKAVEEEMTDTIDTLERAINILERKLRSSTLLQTPIDRGDIGKLLKTLSTIVDAAALSLHDKQALIGLVQSSQQEADDTFDSDLGAPQAAAYQSHSENIIDVLEDLKQKAMAQLDEARKEEVNARHNFQLLKQSLEDQITVATKEMSNSKMAKHDASETKSVAEGEMTVTKKDLEEAETILKNMKSNCETRVSDHETTVANRAEELNALAEAKRVLLEMGEGATKVSYGSASFMQIDGKSVNVGVGGASALQTRADLANFEVVNLLRKVAREQKSQALAELAVRISRALRLGAASGSDPFAKVKALINDLLERLMKESGEEAEHKAYCDKEYGETKTKLDELKYDLEKYTSKLDKAKADSVTLKEEVAQLQSELAETLKSQGKADELRKTEYKVYVQSKSDLEQGLNGIRMALKILREYYADSSSGSASAAASFVQQPEEPELHAKSGGGMGVVAMLEVIESDFGKSLANVELTEETAATAYERMSMENKISKTTMEKDIEYKTKESASLDKRSLEISSDRESAQSELDAVLKYSAKLRGMCEVRPESYEERKGRREAEIAGLREALQILEGEAALLQHRQHGMGLIAIRKH